MNTYTRRQYVQEQAHQRGWGIASSGTTGFISRDIFTRGRDIFDVLWQTDDSPVSVLNHLYDGTLCELNLADSKMSSVLSRLSWLPR